ncbi:hypothetical protein N431DRAFT_515833 [Stipitochalara longipes BDJ]|nr:hypothetical protein N431DRAFT_515833 [Stipitochalara longipes BDJ]
MNDIREGTFITISGHPQKGKTERISRVRSHITRAYFERQKQSLNGSRTPQNKAKSGIEGSSLPTDLAQDLAQANAVFECNIPQEIKFALLSSDHPMRDSSFFKAETAKRMHKFFDLHVRQGDHPEAFIDDLAKWAITIPHYTSSKLLNASGFDDLQDSGELSPWTLRQRSIALRLMRNALENKSEVHIPATIAAMQGLLAFEILNGTGENYARLRRISKGIPQSPQCTDFIWSTLSRWFFLLDQTNRLRMASEKSQKRGAPTSFEIPSTEVFSFPMDFALFTFGDHFQSEEKDFSCNLLVDLYTLLSIAKTSNKFANIPSTLDYVASQWHDIVQKVAGNASQINTWEEDNEKWITASIHLGMFILASILLSGSKISQPYSVSAMYSQLRSLLGTTIAGTKRHGVWARFTGALLWCLAIGARCAEQKDKTWFLMLFMKTAYPWLLVRQEETSKNMCLVSSALEEIKPLLVQEV